MAISMFERLIRAPEGHKVPSSVLAVQRRMRKDVCDLIREKLACKVCNVSSGCLSWVEIDLGGINRYEHAL